MYRYHYGDGEMEGFVKFTLSRAPAEHWTDDGRVSRLCKLPCYNNSFSFQPDCFYKGFRDEEGNLTPVHWYILALKFAFVIIFEHFVFGVCKLIDVIIEFNKRPYVQYKYNVR